MRAQSKDDFVVKVEGVGDFVFGQRTFNDHMKINVEYSRITEAVQPTEWLDTVATWMSTFRVLMVRSPEGFDLDDIDPLDIEVYEKLMRIHRALREKEDSFRLKQKGAKQGSGAAEGGEPGVLVSQ